MTNKGFMPNKVILFMLFGSLGVLLILIFLVMHIVYPSHVALCKSPYKTSDIRFLYGRTKSHLQCKILHNGKHCKNWKWWRKRSKRSKLNPFIFLIPCKMLKYVWKKRKRQEKRGSRNKLLTNWLMIFAHMKNILRL